MPIEGLVPGDSILAVNGGYVPIKWIGRRRIDCAGLLHPEKVWPVRLTAGALGENLPRRDLWLSPGHAVYWKNALIPIKYLINGTTIAQVPADHVTYYHIELDQHDVIFAEGLPSESCLDVGDRTNFENCGSVMRLLPDFSPPSLDIATLWEAKGCAPLVIYGAQLEAARSFVNAQAATMTGASAAA